MKMNRDRSSGSSNYNYEATRIKLLFWCQILHVSSNTIYFRFKQPLIAYQMYFAATKVFYFVLSKFLSFFLMNHMQTFRHREYSITDNKADH